MPQRPQRSLPLFRDVPDLPKTPRVDEVRKRLGGRVSTGARVGEVVGIVTAILNPTRAGTFIGIGFAVTIEGAGVTVGIAPF